MKIKLVHDKCNHNREEKYFVQQNREDQAKMLLWQCEQYELNSPQCGPTHLFGCYPVLKMQTNRKMFVLHIPFSIPIDPIWIAHVRYGYTHICSLKPHTLQRAY